MNEYILSDDQNSLSVVGANRAGADKVFKYKATQAGFGCKWFDYWKKFEKQVKRVGLHQVKKGEKL